MANYIIKSYKEAITELKEENNTIDSYTSRITPGAAIIISITVFLKIFL